MRSIWCWIKVGLLVAIALFAGFVSIGALIVGDIWPAMFLFGLAVISFLWARRIWRRGALTVERVEDNPVVCDQYLALEPVQDVVKQSLAAPEVEEAPLALRGGGRPATERQLDYLNDLGVKVPAGLSVLDASDMISNALEKRPPASDLDREIAAFYGISVGRYTNKKDTFSAILGNLGSRDDLKPLAQWFAYRVYRSEVDRTKRGVLEHPKCDPFPQIAELMMADQSVVRSLKRIANGGDYADLRWFGDYVTPDGEVFTGESKRTAAFLFARDALVERRLLRKEPSETRKNAPVSSGAGCLVLLACFGLVGFAGVGLRVVL